MSELAKKKTIPCKADVPALKGRDNAMNKKQLQPVKNQEHDSEAIERAVYDGMQDLRAKKVSA
jgi:hypothetical protein